MIKGEKDSYFMSSLEITDSELTEKIKKFNEAEMIIRMGCSKLSILKMTVMEAEKTDLKRTEEYLARITIGGPEIMETLKDMQEAIDTMKDIAKGWAE